jgi:hypothetical protein
MRLGKPKRAAVEERTNFRQPAFTAASATIRLFDRFSMQ